MSVFKCSWLFSIVLFELVSFSSKIELLFRESSFLLFLEILSFILGLFELLISLTYKKEILSNFFKFFLFLDTFCLLILFNFSARIFSISFKGYFKKVPRL